MEGSAAIWKSSEGVRNVTVISPNVGKSSGNASAGTRIWMNWKVVKRCRSVWQVLEDLAVFKTRGLRGCHPAFGDTAYVFNFHAADDFLSFPIQFNQCF